ncbi:MAG: hypothetical protein KZQ85_01975 [Candidatus Thiodiazotropha sp. (ex Myrtea sp. 'scaly one' KF741663)]|nr:hypothetical protein [Candidatus Thiodiazotropha sp. (ex Myrtea sp. 'scaly one' KF741663)]
MSESYQVVFTGELSPDTDAERVIERFSEKFKLERAKAEKLIRGAKSVVLKKGLELEKAEKYLAVLQHLGMVVELDPKPPAPEPETAAPTTSQLALEPIDNGGGDTTEVLDPSQLAADRCPKCGSKSMELGICQDCGIVASKFLAAQVRQAEMGPDAEEEEAEANPYSAPEADLVEPMEGEMDGPHGVPASHGWAWIAKGWWHFKEAPIAWILVLVIWFILAMVISIVPLVGAIAVNLMTPVITAGLMYGCYEQDQGDDFAISHLFAGFSNNAGQLVLVGVFYFLLMLLVGGAIMVFFLGSVGLGAMAAQDPEAMAMAFMTPGFIVAILVAFLLFIPVMMAYIFAPALVILDDVNALTAMKLSFMGSLKNLLPLFIFVVLSIVIMIIGSIPFGLGLLVVMPVLTASVYSAYRDIYYS